MHGLWSLSVKRKAGCDELSKGAKDIVLVFLITLTMIAWGEEERILLCTHVYAHAHSCTAHGCQLQTVRGQNPGKFTMEIRTSLDVEYFRAA